MTTEPLFHRTCTISCNTLEKLLSCNLLLTPAALNTYVNCPPLDSTLQECLVLSLYTVFQWGVIKVKKINRNFTGVPQKAPEKDYSESGSPMNQYERTWPTDKWHRAVLTFNIYKCYWFFMTLENKFIRNKSFHYTAWDEKFDINALYAEWLSSSIYLDRKRYALKKRKLECT